MFAFLVTVPVPIWALPIIVCSLGFAVCVWKIGPSRPATHYLPDIATPALKLLALLIAVILCLASLLVLSIGGWL